MDREFDPFDGFRPRWYYYRATDPTVLYLAIFCSYDNFVPSGCCYKWCSNGFLP
ncbi:MAG: hypothetical protein ACPHF2_03220 [Crocinitomicaceae bacterium]